MLKHTLHKETIRDDEALEAHLRQAAVTASERERNAMEAERDIADLYRALYMRAHIGELMEGTVTSVTPTGVYLRIEEPFIDVLVPTDALGVDAYEPDELNLKMVGKRSGDTVALGDTVAVVIEDVSVQRRAVFGKRIVEEGQQRASKKERKRMRREKSQRADRKGRGPRKKGGGRGRGRR
jgi:ribonuclease R